MAYIGTKPTIGNFQICDAISVVNGQAAYTMQVGSVNVIPQSSSHMIVSLNGTIQKPGGANPSFTVSGSTITFASNLATGDVIDFIQILGDVLDLGVPSDATVTAAKLNNDIISGQTALASEPADTDEFLVSDAGTLKRIDYSLIKGGGITEADQWRLTSPFYTDTDPISANLERIDDASAGQLGSGMSVSSGVWTFPSTGIYLVQARCSITNTTGSESVIYLITHATLDNGSNWDEITRTRASGKNTSYNSYTTNSFVLVDVTDTSNVKLKFSTSSHDSGTAMNGVTDRNETGFLFIKLGDT